jgi:peptidoglycan/LPS O-acetylase OafA/YrhL
MPSAKFDTGFIDGLRGLAALWVVVAHCMIWSAYAGFIPNPKIAVDIFIVISGYLITMTFQPDRGVISFYIKRAFRLLPIYYLALTISFLVFDAYAHAYALLQTFNPERWATSLHDPRSYVADIRSYLVHLSMLFGLSPRYAIGSMLPDWSLSLEWQFYLVFPVIGIAAKRYPKGMAIMLTLFAWWWFLNAGRADHSPPLFGRAFPEPSFLPMKLPVFMIGIFACAYRLDPSRRDLRVVTVALMATHTLFAYLFLYGVQAFAFLVLTAPFIVDDRISRITRRLLALPAGKILADTSYCAYLVHGFFIAFLGSAILRWSPLGTSTGDFTAMLSAVLLATYGVSTIAFHTIERPAIGLGKTLALRYENVRRGRPAT